MQGGSANRRTTDYAMQQFRIRVVQIPRWQIVLVAAVVSAILIALFVVAFGVFLLALPIFLLMGALAYLFGLWRPMARRPEAEGRIIDGEYRVVEEKRIEHEREW
jgi:hypothetical protein